MLPIKLPAIKKTTLAKARFAEKIAGRAAMVGWVAQQARPEAVAVMVAVCLALHGVQRFIEVSD